MLSQLFDFRFFFFRFAVARKKKGGRDTARKLLGRMSDSPLVCSFVYQKRRRIKTVQCNEREKKNRR